MMWRAIPGWEGLYEVSDTGLVRNARTGLIRKSYLGPSGHPRVSLYPGGKGVPIHRAVAAAFVGNPQGQVVRHLDGDPTNNTPANLAIGTQGDNNADSVRHGTHYNAMKTHCVNGHEFTPENTIAFGRDGGTKRRCRTCRRAQDRTNSRRRATERTAER